MAFTDYPDEDSQLPCRSASSALEEQRPGAAAFQYAYDFGDGWEHSVEAEAVAKAEPDAVLPQPIAAEGACPPQDVGGPWGYAELLGAVADPKHEDPDEVVEWAVGHFDPCPVETLEPCPRRRGLSFRGCRSGADGDK